MANAVTTHGRSRQPDTRAPELGPILPACPVCGELRYWHDHTTDVWDCWGCVPPVLKTMAPPVGASVLAHANETDE